MPKYNMQSNQLVVVDKGIFTKQLLRKNVFLVKVKYQQLTILVLV
jgi:hypothetical protein